MKLNKIQETSFKYWKRFLIGFNDYDRHCVQHQGMASVQIPTTLSNQSSRLSIPPSRSSVCQGWHALTDSHRWRFLILFEKFPLKTHKWLWQPLVQVKHTTKTTNDRARKENWNTKTTVTSLHGGHQIEGTKFYMGAATKSIKQQKEKTKQKQSLENQQMSSL